MHTWGNMDTHHIGIVMQHSTVDIWAVWLQNIRPGGVVRRDEGVWWGCVVRRGEGVWWGVWQGSVGRRGEGVWGGGMRVCSGACGEEWWGDVVRRDEGVWGGGVRGCGEEGWEGVWWGVGTNKELIIRENSRNMKCSCVYLKCQNLPALAVLQFDY